MTINGGTQATSVNPLKSDAFNGGRVARQKPGSRGDVFFISGQIMTNS
jgi:hypothetical protein